jgi:hypothetical protein
MNARLLFFTCIALYFFNASLHHIDTWHLIDGANLAIHEGGHILFSPFGQFIYILGGSFLQVLAPCIFAYYFFTRQDFFSGSVMMLWLGESIINVSVYMGDAIDMNLPLVGGENVIHDWNYLLTSLGLLSYTETLSKITMSVGFLILIATSTIFIYFENKQMVRDEQRHINL